MQSDMRVGASFETTQWMRQLKSGELYGEALDLRMLSYGVAVASNKIDSRK